MVVAPVSTPTLVYSPHPMSAAANRQLISAAFLPGETIADYLIRQEISLNRPMVLALNDRIIPRHQWGLTCPKASDLITLRATVQKGDSGKVLKTVLMIVVMIYAPQVAASMYGSGTVAAGVATGLMVAGSSLLINALIPPPKLDLNDASGRNQSVSSTYALNGGSNRARLHEPLPLVLGTHRIYPDVGAKPYTEFEGEDQYLYQVFNFGLADIALTDIRIGTTPITDYSDVEMEESGGSNLLIYPNEFDNAAWLKTNTTVTPNAALAPDGTTTADRLVATTDGNDYVHQRYSTTSHMDKTFDYEVWLKNYNLSDKTVALRIREGGSGDVGLAIVTLTDDWQLFTVSCTFSASPTADIRVFIDGQSNGANAGRGFYAWNARLVEAGQYSLSLFPGNVDTLSGAALTAAAGWVERTSSPDTTALAIELSGALFQIDSESGAVINNSVTLWMEYRLVGGPVWLPFKDEATAYNTIANASRKPLRLTFRATVPKGQYEVRVQRFSADEIDTYKVSDITWSQLRCYQPDQADYTGQKRLALRIKASGQLSGTVDQLSALATAKVPVWTGAAWVIQATSNPAWQFLWLTKGKIINGRRAFGANLPDSRIDIEAIKAWATWCDAKSLSCNLIFDRSMNCADQLDIIGRCGRAARTWATGKLGTIWDQSDLPITSVFGMANIRRGSFKVEYITEKLADEVVAKFVNPDLDWQQDEVRATVPGVAVATDPATIELMGVTDADQAGREVLLMAAQQEYRRRRISWEADIEGLVVNRGDVGVLSHDLTQWGYSGRLVSGTASIFTIDRAVPFTEGEVHYVGLRYPDGHYDIYEVAYQAGESVSLALAKPIKKSTWLATMAITTSDEIEPVVWNSHYYKALNSGNTGATEPPWPITSGDTVVDGDITWQEAGYAPQYAPDDDPYSPALDCIWQFEPKATPGKKIKITDVQPISMNHVRITAVDEDPNYYLEEFGTYTHLTPAVAGNKLPTVTGLDVGETLIKVGNSHAVQLSITWDVEGPYGGAIVSIAINGEPMQERGKVTSRRFDLQVPDSGQIAIQITAFDLLGQFSQLSQLNAIHDIIGKDSLPPSVTTFLVQRQSDGTREFIWSAPEPADKAGYKIRYQQGTGHTWETMSSLHEGLLTASPFESNQVAKGTWTFAIKMVDTLSNESTDALYIETTLGDPRLAEVLINEDPRGTGWPGTKTGCYVDELGQLIAEDTKTWDDGSGDGLTWDTWLAWSRAPATTIIYEHDIDAGVVVLFTPLINVTADGTVTIEVNTSEDGASWSGWVAPGSLTTARYIKTRITVADHATLNAIYGANIMLSGKSVNEEINDQNTALLAGAHRIGVGDIRLPIAYDYAVITQVQVALQSVGPGWSWVLMDKDISVGPRINIYNGSVLADATIDASVRGV